MGYRDTDYCSTAELAAYLRIDDSVDDAQLGLAVTAASRAIDRATGRAFGLDASAITREYWMARRYDGSFRVDDISSTTGLVVTFVASEDWSATLLPLTLDTDFRLLPLNAADDARPFESVDVSPATWPCGFARMLVTAKFGWPAVPTAIKQAALVQASRFFKRRDAPFGVAGSPELGSELRLLDRVDPDVAVMLQGYIRRWSAV